MRNADVLTLVRDITDVANGANIDAEMLNQIERWAKLGTEESGDMAYRVVLNMAKQFVPAQTAVDFANKVAAPEASKPVREAAQDQPPIINDPRSYGGAEDNDDDNDPVYPDEVPEFLQR